jgi:DNA-binding NtrC family response regulator
MTTLTINRHIGRVMVVDDHDRARESMADALSFAGHDVRACGSAAEALHVLDGADFDVIITDLRMPGMGGLEFIRALEERKVDSQIAMVTAHATVTAAVDAMRHGAFDFIEKPFTAGQLEELVDRALRHGVKMGKRSSVPSALGDSPMLIGQSPAMQLLRQRIAQVAPTSETILITGESGVGKELVATYIHAQSRRASEAMVRLNCPALSPQLLESELFGHERGAFTSADAPRIGRFELADRGTIFLDEITEIDAGIQAKLLRVLQERTFERVGSSVTQKVDVRVITAANRDLRSEVKAGRFREDLYFRLAVIPLPVPALRERLEDIPVLAEHFLSAAASRMGRAPLRMKSCATSLLQSYSWPGNVRELENLLTRASVLCVGDSVAADELRPWLGEVVATPVISPTQSLPFTAGVKLDDMERQLIEVTLQRYKGHRVQTAQALGIGVRTLTNKLRLYGYGPRENRFAKAG